MQKTKFIQLLKQLNNLQLKHLELFFRSPYHNKREELVRLLHYCMQYAPDFESPHLDRAEAYTAIFPGLALDEKALGYCLSFSVKLVEDFILAEKVNEDVQLRNLHLMEQYRTWNMEQSFEASLKLARKALENEPLRNADFFLNNYQTDRRENEFFDQKKKHEYDQSLQQAVDNLDRFYFATKLKYCCEMENRQQLVQKKYNLTLSRELLSLIPHYEHLECPPVLIYGTILRSLTEPENEEHFINLNDLTARYFHYFPPTERREILLYAINYCVRRINRGHYQYQNNLFDVYKRALSNKILLENNMLSPWTFSNITLLALKLKEYSWAENFIDECSPYLNESFRSNAYHYNKALLHFEKTDFGLAQKMLMSVQYDDVFYAVKSKMLLMRIYYEENQLDPLFSLGEAFKKYLQRNRILINEKKEIYLNFIKYLISLAKIRNKDKSRLDGLKARIEQDHIVSNKPWLLAKISKKY